MKMQGTNENQTSAIIFIRNCTCCVTADRDLSVGLFFFPFGIQSEH